MNLKAMELFRETYRSQIHKNYSGWLHMLTVASVGIIAIIGFSFQIQQATFLEWLTLPITIICVNFAEYAAHRWLGHKRTKLGGLFYSRHTGDHHSFFIEDYMPYQSIKDWRVVLFPTYLIFAFLIGLILPIGALLYIFASPNVAFLMGIGGIFGYLFYEIMHFSYHLPNGSFVERVPVWRELRQLHNLHHRRSIMAKENFNITLPIFDFILGTLYWEKSKK